MGNAMQGRWDSLSAASELLPCGKLVQPAPTALQGARAVPSLLANKQAVCCAVQNLGEAEYLVSVYQVHWAVRTCLSLWWRPSNVG